LPAFKKFEKNGEKDFFHFFFQAQSDLAAIFRRESSPTKVHQKSRKSNRIFLNFRKEKSLSSGYAEEFHHRKDNFR